MHPRRARANRQQDFFVNNPHGFYDGLPEQDLVGSKRSRPINFADPTAVKRARLDRMEAQLNAMHQRV